MNILLPMDMTEVSFNACQYALSRFPAAIFTIIHVISGILDFKATGQAGHGVTQDVVLRNELEHGLLEHLNITDLPKNMHIEVYYGEPVNVITKYLEVNSFDAVFVGSRDKYNLLDRIIGTTSLGIVKKARQPIYMIPRYAGYHGYRKIMVACDENINDPDVIRALDYWNSTNAQIKFLHVDRGDDENFVKTKETLLKQLYEEYQPPFSYEIEKVKGRDVPLSLLANAYNYKADLLIVLAHRASFVHSLVYKSVSKDLIMKSDIPVLFLHANKK